MLTGPVDLTSGPIVMGAISITRDTQTEQAIVQGDSMLQQGAAILDIGMSRSSDNITVQEELDRLIPIIEILSHRMGIPISVATSNPDVMVAAVNSGAKLINDVISLTKAGALSTAAKLEVPVCLMHLQRDPAIMYAASNYQDVISEAYKYLQQRIEACVAGGISLNRIIIDPGFGFDKNLQHNLSLLRSLQVFKNLQCPLLVGMSHKSMIGQILDVAAEKRIYGELTASVIAIGKGANIIRTHNVQAVVDAIKVIKAVE